MAGDRIQCIIHSLDTENTLKTFLNLSLECLVFYIFQIFKETACKLPQKFKVRACIDYLLFLFRKSFLSENVSKIQRITEVGEIHIEDIVLIHSIEVGFNSYCIHHIVPLCCNKLVPLLFKSSYLRICESCEVITIVSPVRKFTLNVAVS